MIMSYLMIAFFAVSGAVVLGVEITRDVRAIRATRAGAPTHTDGQGYLTAGQ